MPNSGAAVADARDQAGGSIVAATRGTAAVTSRTTNAPAAAVTIIPTGTVAFIGANAVVTADGSITVHAEDNLEFDVLLGNASLGLVGIGAGIGILNLRSNVEAFIDTGAQITAGSDANDNVIVKAVFNEDLKGQSYGGTIGALGLSGQVLIFNDHSSQRAHINDGVQIIQAGGSVDVTARTNRDFDVEAIGGNLAGLAVGSSVAHIKIEPSEGKAGIEAVTSATLGDNVQIGMTTGKKVNNLSVTADSDIDARSYTVAAAVGVAPARGEGGDDADHQGVHRQWREYRCRQRHHHHRQVSGECRCREPGRGRRWSVHWSIAGLGAHSGRCPGRNRHRGDHDPRGPAHQSAGAAKRG